MTDSGLKLCYRNNGDGKAIFLYGTLLLIGYNREVTAVQFTCAFYDAGNLTILCPGAAHVITYLNQTFHVCSLTQDEVHFLVVS